jgi:hypothetical protein
MALFDTTTTKKKKLFGDEQSPSSRLFSELPTGEEDNPTQAGIGKTLRGMISGDAYDPYRTQQRETLARGAQQLRAETGSGVAGSGMLGQGQAVQSQQGTEQRIFQTLSDTETGMNIAEQEMKERGIGLATDIGSAQEQSRQFDVSQENALKITQMQINTEKWKTEQTANLTKAGWDFEGAQAKLDRDLQDTLTTKSLVLQEKIANGQLTQAQAELAQQASQFTNQLEWEKEATKLGIAAEDAKMAWQTNERVASQTFAKTEADLDRQLDREIEEGRLTLQEKEIAQQATQIALQYDQLEWQKEATKLGLDDAASERIWKSTEAALDRIEAANMRQIELAFTEKGWNYQTLIGNIDNLDEKQAAALISQSAILAGITYETTDENGNKITVPGIKTTPYKDVSDVWQPGELLTGNDYDATLGDFEKYVDEGIAIDSNDIVFEGTRQFKYDNGRWKPTESTNEAFSELKGKIIKSKSGNLYEFVGYHGGSTILNIPVTVFRDLKTGTTVSVLNGAKLK